MYRPSIALCPLFAGIDEEKLRYFLLRTVSEIRTFQKGELIVKQGDVVNFLHILIEGIVRTQMITKDGNVVEIEFIEPVRPLAPAFIFANYNRFPVDVISMEECTIYTIPKNVWLAEMMSNEVLLTNFLKLNSNMTVFLSNKVQMLSIKSLKGKLSLYILENTTIEKNSFMLRRTQTQLAEHFGVQRPSLARTLGELISEGVISLYKRELTVLNRRKLEQFI